VVLPDGSTRTIAGEYETHQFSVGANTDHENPIVVVYYGAGGIAFVFQRNENANGIFPDRVTVLTDIDRSRAGDDISKRLGGDFDMLEMAHQKPQ
jgi:hypothetical protein